MGPINWSDISASVAAVLVIGMVALALLKFMRAQNLFFANHLNHLTDALGRLADAIVELRIHCAQRLDDSKKD